MSNSNHDSTDRQEPRTEHFDPRGVTHCYPHRNKMPCAKCARRLAESLKQSKPQEADA